MVMHSRYDAKVQVLRLRQQPLSWPLFMLKASVNEGQVRDIENTDPET